MKQMEAAQAAGANGFDGRNTDVTLTGAEMQRGGRKGAQAYGFRFGKYTGDGDDAGDGDDEEVDLFHPRFHVLWNRRWR